jgi:anti-sigma factor RsiW
MMDHELRISAYADGELDPHDVGEVEKEIAADPTARELARLHGETTALLRAACAPQFYQQGAPQLHRSPPPAAPRRPSLRRMAIAATLLIGIVGTAVGVLVNREQSDSLLDEVSTYHWVYGRETEHLVEVPASRRTELSAWLGERLGRKLVVPELSTARFAFAGGRMLVVDGKPVAQLMYTRAGTFPLGVCVTASSKPAAPVQVDRRNGLDLAWWRDGTYVYVIVGTIPEAEARDLADRVAAQMRS